VTAYADYHTKYLKIRVLDHINSRGLATLAHKHTEKQGHAAKVPHNLQLRWHSFTKPQASDQLYKSIYLPPSRAGADHALIPFPALTPNQIQLLPQTKSLEIFPPTAALTLNNAVTRACPRWVLEKHAPILETIQTWLRESICNSRTKHDQCLTGSLFKMGERHQRS
jgi:hypothetical protein